MVSCSEAALSTASAAAVAVAADGDGLVFNVVMWLYAGLSNTE